MLVQQEEGHTVVWQDWRHQIGSSQTNHNLRLTFCWVAICHVCGIDSAVFAGGKQLSRAHPRWVVHHGWISSSTRSPPSTSSWWCSTLPWMTDVTMYPGSRESSSHLEWNNSFHIFSLKLGKVWFGEIISKILCCVFDTFCQCLMFKIISEENWS
jgi:hypothetical protein